MRTAAPVRETCVEAQIMDLADDIAYSRARRRGRHRRRTDRADPALPTQACRYDVWETVRDWYAPATSTDELEAGFARLSGLDAWPRTAYDGSRRQLAGLKNLTSRLINRFCSGVQEAVELTDLPRPIVRYAGRIPVPAEVGTEIAILKGIAAHLVMKADDRVTALTRQRTSDRRARRGDLGPRHPATLEPAFADDWAAADDDAARRRVVVDQVASLTDLSAVDRHRAP